MTKLCITILFATTFNYHVVQSMESCTQETLFKKYSLDIRRKNFTYEDSMDRYENNKIAETTHCVSDSSLKNFLVYPLGNDQRYYCIARRCTIKEEGRGKCKHKLSPTQESFGELQDNVFFKHYSLPILTCLKIFQKNNNLKIPKPIQGIILKKSFEKPHYTRYTICKIEDKSYNAQKQFPTYKLSQIFLDDQPTCISFMLLFSDPQQTIDHKNIAYVQSFRGCGFLIAPHEKTCYYTPNDIEYEPYQDWIEYKALGSMNMEDIKKINILQFPSTSSYQLSIIKKDDTIYALNL